MTLTTGATLARENGSNCGHLTIDVTVAGRTVPFRFHISDLQAEPPDTIEEAREMILQRFRTAAKEAGATTLAQLRTAIESKTFKT